jgi:4-carboxymuconolactone decarboxylase
MTKTSPGRLPHLRPDELTEEQRRLYDELTGGPRSQGRQFFPLLEANGGLAGPFNAMLASPRVGSALQALGAALRYESSLPDRAREIVILTVAAHLGSDYEWSAHEPQARHCGVPDVVIASLRKDRPPELADPAERAAYQLARALLHREKVPDDLYRPVRAALDASGVFEVSTLVGYYWLLATQLRLFQVETPDPLLSAELGRKVKGTA